MIITTILFKLGAYSGFLVCLFFVRMVGTRIHLELFGKSKVFAIKEFIVGSSEKEQIF